MCKHKCDAFPALGLTKQGSFNYLQLFTLPYQLSAILFFTFSSIFDKYFIWTRRSLAVSRSPANRNLRVKYKTSNFPIACHRNVHAALEVNVCQIWEVTGWRKQNKPLFRDEFICSVKCFSLSGERIGGKRHKIMSTSFGKEVPKYSVML